LLALVSGGGGSALSTDPRAAAPVSGAAVACRNDRYAAAQNQAICADGRRAYLLVRLRLMVGGKVLTLP